MKVKIDLLKNRINQLVNEIPKTNSIKPREELKELKILLVKAQVIRDKHKIKIEESTTVFGENCINVYFNGEMVGYVKEKKYGWSKWQAFGLSNSFFNPIKGSGSRISEDEIGYFDNKREAILHILGERVYRIEIDNHLKGI